MARAHETSRPYRTRPRTRTAEGVSDLVKPVLAITRRLTATMREVWAMQPRFEERSGQRPFRLLELPRFRMERVPKKLVTFVSAEHFAAIYAACDKAKMPADRPGSLNREKTSDILAYVFNANQFPAGTTELANQSEYLKQIRFEAAKPEGKR